jgi:hypothetical protein
MAGIRFFYKNFESSHPGLFILIRRTKPSVPKATAEPKRRDRRQLLETAKDLKYVEKMPAPKIAKITKLTEAEIESLTPAPP